MEGIRSKADGAPPWAPLRLVPTMVTRPDNQLSYWHVWGCSTAVFTFPHRRLPALTVLLLSSHTGSAGPADGHGDPAPARVLGVPWLCVTPLISHRVCWAGWRARWPGFCPSPGCPLTVCYSSHLTQGLLGRLTGTVTRLLPESWVSPDRVLLLSHHTGSAGPADGHGDPAPARVLGVSWPCVTPLISHRVCWAGWRARWPGSCPSPGCPPGYRRKRSVTSLNSRGPVRPLGGTTWTPPSPPRIPGQDSRQVS